MIGIKGREYLDAIWELAIERGCKCQTDNNFAQDVLGEIRCSSCKTIIISQIEVDKMEANNILPKPKLSRKKLNNWFTNTENEKEHK